MHNSKLTTQQQSQRRWQPSWQRILEARQIIERLDKDPVTLFHNMTWFIFGHTKAQWKITCCFVPCARRETSPFDIFHKLKYIKQCNFVVTFIQWKDDDWLQRGGCDGLDSKVYLFILDSRQLEAGVGSNDLFISCHVLGSVDAMLRFIHAVGLLKLAVLVPVHACTQQIILVFVWVMYPI